MLYIAISFGYAINIIYKAKMLLQLFSYLYSLQKIERKTDMGHKPITLKKRYGATFPETHRDRTENKGIERAEVPSIMVFPMSMHIGAPAKPCVSVGDKVKIGTLVGEAQGFVSANVHSSVSGEVVSIENRDLNGRPVECVIVKNDHQDVEEAPFEGAGENVSPEKVIDLIRQAGISGMGGAQFPTSVKLSPKNKEEIDTLVINGAECEPYSTSDYRTIIEFADQLIEGIKIVDSVFNVKSVYLGLEDDMMEAAKVIDEKFKEQNLSNYLVKVVPAQYPQGSEKQLIENCTGIQVPAGALPADIGVVVSNTSTFVAIYNAVRLGKPLTERVTTITGTPIKDPKNLLVRIGTPIDDLIDQCGGFQVAPRKVINGGPMMGQTIKDGGIPISKGTTHVTFLSADEVDERERMDCIRCAECLNVCPVSLQPILISNAYERGDIAAAKELGAMDCIECGNCTFICPSNIPILENIRKAKISIREMEA